MAAIAFTAVFVLLGLFWIAPPEKLSALLSTAGAERLATSAADTAFGFRGRYLSAAQCGSCHARHLEEWRRSFHARSMTSDNFIHAFSQYLDSLGTERAEPRSSLACLSCHAPLVEKAGLEIVRQVTNLIAAKQTEKLDGFEVGCAACHLAGDNRFSGPIANPMENSFHASTYSASYRHSSFCASCHTWVLSAVPCSDVYTDWRKSRAAKRGTTCQSCHMTESTGAAAMAAPQRKVHSHDFPGARSSAMLKRVVTLGLKAAFKKDRLEVTAVIRNLVPHRVPDGCPWNSYAVLETTVSDETGWEFETIKRVYANLGLDENGETTAVPWHIVKTSPDSTALKAEEIRFEKLSFAVEPRDGKRFMIHARMRYQYTPATRDGLGKESDTNTMAEATLTLPGKRPS